MMRLPVRGYEGIYEVDENGNIYSIPRWVKGGKQFVKGGKRGLSLHGTGYLTVRLSDEVFTKTHRVHRIVANAFIPNPEKKPFVNHINGNKEDNRVTNLEWVTEKENTEHAIKEGLFKVSGVNNPSCRFNYSDVCDWYVLITYGVSIKDISNTYGCNRNSIPRLIKMEFGDVLPQYKGKVRYSPKDE